MTWLGTGEVSDAAEPSGIAAAVHDRRAPPITAAVIVPAIVGDEPAFMKAFS
ncbi:hypothetical protein AURDEDRAFT_178463 [Auricularia subglabra TFB-10046 SS5]|uniref:Uncharacterized protein n=1 Tax=Auricularia subglabra (strain TFB-10046 / SS5) TaxID=717982 RepID=J0WJM5_AURST|nr:hypothetical protein AURDEDRAFT_178463 [Auricularia subglabra TFB-10046 SS5]